MLQEAFQSFQDLDSHINSVATKVVHLGDQLESVNTPRSRAVEAQRLMDHFMAFLHEGPLVSEVFTDESKVLINMYHTDVYSETSIIYNCWHVAYLIVFLYYIHHHLDQE